MAFESEIDALLHPSLFHVAAIGQPLPIAALTTSVTAVMRSDERIGIYIFPAKPNRPCAFTLLAHGRLPRQVFVDQYSGRVLGSLSVLRFVLVAHALHEVSGPVMGCAALILIPSVVSGLYLWWPLKRIKIALQGAERRLCFDLHNSVGFLSSLFLLVFSVTGAYMAFDSFTVPATYKLTGSKPSPEDPSSTVVADAVPISPDSAVRIAMESLPTATPLWITMPEDKTAAYLVKMRFPEDPSSNGASIVWVDQFSGRVLAEWNSRKAHLARRIESANRALHSGDMWGYPSRTLACLMSLCLVLQATTGPYLWWKRRRANRMNPTETAGSA